jgi:hypothetical protein
MQQFCSSITLLSASRKVLTVATLTLASVGNECADWQGSDYKADQHASVLVRSSPRRINSNQSMLLSEALSGSQMGANVSDKTAYLMRSKSEVRSRTV